MQLPALQCHAQLLAGHLCIPLLQHCTRSPRRCWPRDARMRLMKHDVNLGRVSRRGAQHGAGCSPSH